MPPSEKNFWSDYLEHRKKRLPIESNIYETLEEHYQNERKDFHNEFSGLFSKKLPKATIEYYNEIFDEAHKTVQGILKDKRVQSESRALAKSSLDIQLPKNSCLKDLLDLDVFADKTVNQDIHPSLILKNIRSNFSKFPHLEMDSFHFFFHRPQKSKHIFFHEIVVGNLINEVSFEREHYTSTTLPLDYENYPAVAHYTLKQICETIGICIPQAVALHVADSKTVSKQLPKFIRDLMLVASHIYWYLDFFSKKEDRWAPSDILSIVYLFFVIPSLKFYSPRGKYRLLNHAGIFIEDRMFQGLIHRKPQSISILSLVDILNSLANELWIKKN